MTGTREHPLAADREPQTGQLRAAGGFVRNYDDDEPARTVLLTPHQRATREVGDDQEWHEVETGTYATGGGPSYSVGAEPVPEPEPGIDWGRLVLYGAVLGMVVAGFLAFTLGVRLGSGTAHQAATVRPSTRHSGDVFVAILLAFILYKVARKVLR